MSSHIENIKATIKKVMGLGSASHGLGQPVTRILFIANALIPTLQLSFSKPLAKQIAQGTVLTDLLSEFQIKELVKLRRSKAQVQDWITKRIRDFDPTIIIFCRYSGPHADHVTRMAEKMGIPTVFHVDDDLLNVPVEIGQKKFEFHNSPPRLETVRHLFENVDLVYCSTQALKNRIVSYGFENTFLVGEIYCSGKVLAPAEDRPVKKIGYMGFDHAHDLEMVLPAIVQVLRENSEIGFELFGSIPKPVVLEEFGARITVIPPIPNYEEFLEKFSTLQWDIGICPLAKTDFNAVKANTKWVEYTSVGTAVVASANTIYDGCCADGCGLLAADNDEWVRALDNLIRTPGHRVTQVKKAQQKLINEYSIERLEQQVAKILDVAQRSKKPQT